MTADAVGGVWQYATDLAEQLAGAGHAVTLAVMGPPPDAAQRGRIEGVAGVRVAITGLPLDWMCADARECVAAAQALARLVRECGADLLHCNSPALVGAVPFPVPVVAAAHGCIATWWQAARGGEVDAAWRWHGELMRRGLAAADAVLAPSASFAELLEATYGLARRPQVVHNGRPPTVIGDPGPHRLHAALAVGRMWDPVKNAALLEEAAAALPELNVLAAGPLRGPHGEEATFSHVIALGPLPGRQLAELLALRPIFVSPATFEPFGLAVLEAAAAGCALVLSDIPTFRELWDGAAVFADPADPAAFAAAIARVHETPDLRWALGEAAHARSVRFTPAATARGVTAVYRPLLPASEVAA